MSKTIKLKQGFDIRLKGKAGDKLVQDISADVYALKPTDFHHITRPKVLVKEGERVKAGTPIFFDKKNPTVMLAAPVSGEVIEVKRGERRFPLEIKILADKTLEYEQYPTYKLDEIGKLNRREVIDLMAKSGVWANIIERPFGLIAHPEHTPKAIFISGFDTAPLAPDYDMLLQGEEAALQAGIEALRKLTDGKVYLSLPAKNPSKVLSGLQGVEINYFEGKHPAGNVGVHIHHLAPIAKGEYVWTVHPHGVAQIGKLFLKGIYDATTIFALTGSEVAAPQYYKTYRGAQLRPFLQGNLTRDEHEVRIISGNVLTGEKVSLDGFLGFYHHQVTVIPEGNYYDFMGWILPTSKTSRSLSFHRGLGMLSALFPKKEYVLDTNYHGEERPFVQTGIYEQVLPMDIYVEFLLKACLANDLDNMEALGIYEVIEEDIALCEFIDPSKQKMQKTLRDGIETLLNS
ncbi:MAG: Na(+)-translocating NADH-quinone reductase subunit A [Thermonema sp.]|uniref:Na(+)-translocating NADH-quinone reductase subunit A n=1 Tax=Thermonema TaxID=28194 RepID=UPI0005702075|nr:MULTISPECIES: Na(+)-translocating NADH-quinone reductase subunit A [Thermonema]GIV38320.1 MAG: Na(+)-translocating NADH-quinone reductase subunit A [Thermonema sp.]